MNKKPIRRVLQGPLMYLLLLAIILLAVQMLGSTPDVTPQTLSYTTLLDWVEADLRRDLGETLTAQQQEMSIDRLIIQSKTVYGRIENSVIPDAQFGSSYDFKCILPSEEQFYSDVGQIYESTLNRPVSPTEYRFEVTTALPAGTPWWMDFLPLFLSVLMFGLLWYFIMRQQTGGGKGVMSFSKSRARLTDPGENKVTFNDVAGADEEKEELQEIVQFLKDPVRFTKLGAKIPTGV
ncbi:MAG: hypothetical protein U0L09_00240, partial [Christensenellales bacterium]|nr:hypothetical protein [Christensenellales bacterium]